MSNTRHTLARAGLRMAIALVLLAAPTFAQFRASIQGTVTDTQGGAIPNATLTLTDTDTNHTLTATSNGAGVFNFNALAPDHYSLTAEAAGFKKQTIQGVQITPEQANAVNVQLSVGDVSTNVNVSANTLPAIETATATISGTVDSNEIQHLASSGRDVLQLVQLAPGVFGDGSQAAGSNTNSNLPGTQGPGGSTRSNGIFQTENGPQASANGGQTETNGISIDGISTTSAVWGGTSVITPGEDTVGSVKVLSNGYDAENGRFSGANVEITSKTGTNDYHGSFFFRASRPGLNAYQRYNGSGTFNPGGPAQRGLLRDTERANQYGGSVGGPILHNRVFAFFGYETQRDNSAQTATGWYDTAAFRAAAPAGSIASKFLGFNGAAVAASSQIDQTCASAGFTDGTNCHEIAGQGLDLGSPLRQALGTQDLSWQSTSNPGLGGGLDGAADIAFYNTVNPTTRTASQYNGRIDVDATQRDHVSFAIYWVPLSSTTYNGPVRPYNLFHHNQTNDAYSGIWNHTFSPTLLNEARANDAGYRYNEITSNPQSPFGLPTAQVDTIGNLSTGNNTQVNAFGTFGPGDYNQHTFSYKDVATKIFGNHSVKFGGEVTRLYYLNDPTYSVRPSYNFYNLWDFLNDAPHSETGFFNPLTGTPATNRQDSREDLYGFFAQDEWKATPALTLNYGLRYSYFGPLSSKENNLNVVVLGTGADTFTGLSIRRGGNLTNAQKGNFGPQFGFAYSPDAFRGKAVLRGGYGLNYNQSQIAITGNVNGNPPNILQVGFASGSPSAIDPRIVYSIATDPSSLFGYPPNPNTIGGFNAQNLPTSGGASLVAYQANQPTILTHHYSLDTQIDLGHQYVATVGYQGSVTHHLIVNSQLYGLGFANGTAQNPLVQNISFFGNTGNSNYNALLVGFKHNLSRDFQFDAEFQYSKSFDTGSGPYYNNPYPFRPDLAYGRSDFNFGKAFKVYGLYQPKFFHGNGFATKLADGWTISGIFNLHTGFPFTPTYNVPGGALYYASSGYTQIRPASYNGGAHRIGSNDAFENGKPNLNFPNAGANQPYFTAPIAPVSGPSGFASGLPQLPGVARNSFDGPGYRDVDATVSKAFGLPRAKVLGESASIEIRADAFNLFNLTNLNSSSINTDITQATFGQASSGLAGRIVNLQARFNF